MVKIEIDVKDRKISKLSIDAHDSLKDQIEVYVSNILDEASRIERLLRENGAKEEITSNHILQSAKVNKKNFVKKPTYLKVFGIINPISFMLAGWLFDINGYQDKPFQMCFFIAILLVAVSTLIIMKFKGAE